LVSKKCDLEGQIFLARCVFDPQDAWTVSPNALRSQGKHTPFGGYELPGRVRATVVGGHLAFVAQSNSNSDATGG
jgi:dihydroorotase-like cyclic amidohydrolase